MVKFFDEIPDFIVPWVKEQKMFWVATAPLTADGHVNVSPKGVFAGNFTIVNSKQVWYEDLTGSGVETLSHVRENGRITIMFIAFDGPPRICRMFGKGIAYEFGTPEYNALIPPEKRQAGSRSVIVVNVYKASTSCGYSVPFYSFQGYRLKYQETAARFENHDYAAQQDETKTLPEKGLRHYWKTNNEKSLDGLPGLKSAPESQGRFRYTDPKTIKYKELSFGSTTRSRVASHVAAFTLGAVVSVWVVRLLGN